MRGLRVGIGVLAVAFMVVFFLPLIPFSTPVHVSCSFSCPGLPPPGSVNSGYNSIGYLVTGWGAVYSGWQGGYLPPTISYELSGELTTLTAFGALLAVVLPIVVCCVGLFSREIVKLSRVSRISFTVFGAFVFAFWSLIVATEQPFLNPVFLLEGIWMIPVGAMMVAYGMGRWTFGVPNAQSA